MVGLNPTQRNEVIDLIKIWLNEQAYEQRTEQNRIRAELEREGENSARKSSEYQNLHEAYSRQTAEKQQAMEASTAHAGETQGQMTGALAAEFAQKQEQIDALVAWITSKQQEMQAMKNAMEAILSRSDASCTRPMPWRRFTVSFANQPKPKGLSLTTTAY